MSGGLKLRTGWRATNSSDLFPRGLDVTASMSVFQTERAGAAPAGRTFFISLPSWCNSSIPPCDGDGAGADPAEGTFLTNGVSSERRSHLNRVQDKEPSQQPAKLPYPVQVWGTRPFFHRIRESQRTRLFWRQEAPGAAPGYPTPFSVSRLTVKAPGS